MLLNLDKDEIPFRLGITRATKKSECIIALNFLDIPLLLEAAASLAATPSSLGIAMCYLRGVLLSKVFAQRDLV